MAQIHPREFPTSRAIFVALTVLATATALRAALVETKLRAALPGVAVSSAPTNAVAVLEAGYAWAMGDSVSCLACHGARGTSSLFRVRSVVWRGGGRAGNCVACHRPRKAT